MKPIPNSALQVPTPLLGLMQQTYQQCLQQFGPDQGCYAAPKILEDALGETVKSPGFENWTYNIENVEGALHVRHQGIDHNPEAPQGQKSTVV